VNEGRIFFGIQAMPWWASAGAFASHDRAQGGELTSFNVHALAAASLLNLLETHNSTLLPQAEGLVDGLASSWLTCSMMKLPAFLIFAFIGLCFGAEAKPLSGSRPNIIFIITDDHGMGDLSCTGNP
jgi:hypothetical protein